jgi:hypothetical protein
MLQDPCQRAYTNAQMRRMGFAAFRECIAIEQRRLLNEHYRRPNAGDCASSRLPSWRDWVRRQCCCAGR